jgi:DNA-binding CsgD family transcriptional regulator
MAEAKILSSLLHPVLRLSAANAGVSGRDLPHLMAEAGAGPGGKITPVENGLLENAPEEMRLSAREKEVLKLLAQGNTSRKIAAILGISPRTVEAHRANIMTKLDVHSAAELIYYAIRHHILQG